MINGLGYKLANVPTVTGLSSVVADSIISDTTNTGTLILNGVDVSTALAQVPINTNNITLLQQATTGITYNATGDLTTIDNNVLISSTKYINSNRVPTTGDNLTNKTYVDTAIANLVDSAPATLDTLNELAFALGDDPNFATTITTLIAGKASLSATQNITGATTMSNALNVFYGDGSNLTNVSTNTIALTPDDSAGDWFIPYSKTATTSNTLYIDNTTTPLTYNANLGRLSANGYTINGSGQVIGTNTSAIYQVALQSVFINYANTGRIRFYVHDSTPTQKNPFNINSTNCDTTVPLAIVSTVASNVPSLTIKDTSALNQLNFIPNVSTGSFNGMNQSGDNSIYASGTVDTEVLTLTTHSNTTTGMRILPNGIVLGSGGTLSGTPNVRININGLAGTMNMIAPADITMSATSNINFQTGGITRFYVAPGGVTRFSSNITMNSTSAGNRQIEATTFYINDDSVQSNGARKASLYSTPTNTFLDMLSGVDFTIRINGVSIYKTTSTANTFYKPISITDGTNTTTMTQNSITGLCEFSQNYTNGGYSFISQSGQAVSTSGSIVYARQYNVLDSGVDINFTKHNYTNPNYTIENSGTSGNIYFKTVNASFVVSTPFTINSTNCVFTQPPICSVSPTTNTMLCNKSYVDTNCVTTTGTQTISGQKSFTNVANTYAGSGASLTGVVNLTADQTIAGNKTFTSNVIFTNNSFTSTLDQNDKYFNITNNTLNNTTVTITGLIPSVNTSCIVRTDAVGVVGGYAAVSGTNITGALTSPGYSPFLNNFFILGTTATTSDITVVSLSTIQSTSSLFIGTYLTTFIGTRFSLGTYITADLGSGVYSITPNALVASAAKAATGVSFTQLNRAFTAGGAVNGSILLDYNTATNIQCLNTSSVVLNAISVEPKNSSSEVSMYGDVKFQGAMKYCLGNTITSTRTLTYPLPQFFLITNAAAITVSFPTAIADYTGVVVIFKRFATAGGAVTFNQTGGAVVMVGAGSLNATASVSLAVGAFQCKFICTGTAWFQLN